MKSNIITKFTTDSAYTSKTIKQHLNACTCNNHIHETGYSGNPLNTQPELTNSIESEIRVRVKHIFDYMTNPMNAGVNLKAIGKKGKRIA